PTSANLLYNVAYTSELLGNLEDAIDYYRAYMRALPPTATDERKKTFVTLRRLEGRLAEQPKNSEGEPPAPTPEPSHGFGRADLGFGVSLGAGAALVAGGAIAGGLALGSQNDVKTFVVGRDGSLSKRNELRDRTNTLALSADLMFATGAALVVAAG